MTAGCFREGNQQHNRYYHFTTPTLPEVTITRRHHPLRTGTIFTSIWRGTGSTGLERRGCVRGGGVGSSVSGGVGSGVSGGRELERMRGRGARAGADAGLRDPLHFTC